MSEGHAAGDGCQVDVEGVHVEVVVGGGHCDVVPLAGHGLDLFGGGQDGTDTGG